MKAGFATKRRADRFDALVSGGAHDPQDRDAALLEVVSAMREVPPVEARPEFVSSLRERLVAEAATMPAADLDRATVEHLSLHQPTVRRERRIATVLGGLAVASATTSMAVASQGALPGETLYPVKRAIENAQSTFQSDGSDKASTLLDHAEQRLAEARELTADGGEASEVADALNLLNSQATEATTLAIADYEDDGDTAGVNDVRAFTATALAELTALSDHVPEDARAALVGAVNALHNIESAAANACPTCTGPAALPDPELVANLESLLSGDPSNLESLAQAAEDVAAEAPGTTGPSDGPSTSGPSDAASGTPSAPETPTDPTTVVPDPLPTSKGPIGTLLDDVEKDIDDLEKKAKEEDWTLLDNGLIDGITEGLGLTSSND